MANLNVTKWIHKNRGRKSDCIVFGKRWYNNQSFGESYSTLFFQTKAENKIFRVLKYDNRKINEEAFWINGNAIVQTLANGSGINTSSLSRTEINKIQMKLITANFPNSLKKLKADKISKSSFLYLKTVLFLSNVVNYRVEQIALH